MTKITILSIFLVIALVAVSLVNQAQERRRIKRLRQRRLRHQAANLEEVFECLIKTLPDPVIAKHVNDEQIDILQAVLALEQTNIEHLETHLQTLEARGEELINSRQKIQTSYQKDSDVQIAQAHHYINEAGRVLRYRCSQGLITDEDLEVYQGELSWAYLMVSVISLIAQGQKASLRNDMFSAHAFYQKAQHSLMESAHPNPKRLRLIKELAELIAGNRNSLSTDLMPTEPSAIQDT